MLDTMIGRHIRRSTRNLLIWNTLILIGIFVFFVVTNRYWYNFLLGPFTLDRETVTNFRDARDADRMEYRVTVNGDVCADTGERHFTTHKGRTRESGKYFVLRIDNKLLLVRAPMSASPEDIERRGVLDAAPSEIVTRLDQQLNRQDLRGGVRPTFLPVMLDSTITRTKGWIALGILLPTGLINVLNIFRAMARFGNPQNHPLATALRRYGEPEEVAQKIEDEFNSDDRQVIGPVTFTRRWLIRPRTFGVDAMFLGDAAWTYQSVVQNSTHGIPTGKTYSAILCDIHGTQVAVQLKSEAQTTEFVLAVQERVPWVLVGYTDELDRLWKKDRPALVRLVEESRLSFAEEIRRAREQPEDEEPIDVEPA